jgi:RNA polymerase sigma-70 factor (ECF subfamily)
VQTKDQDGERELIAGLCRGDEAALQALIDKYASRLFRSAEVVLHRHDLAKEAVRNVFVSLWLRRETLVINTDVRAYLLKAVNYQALKLLRDETHPEDVCIDDVAPEKLLEDFADSELQRKECLEEVVATLLQAMPPLRRKVFWMHRIENLGYKEIAEALGITVNVVEKQMAVAKREVAALRAELRRRLNRR